MILYISSSNSCPVPKRRFWPCVNPWSPGRHEDGPVHLWRQRLLGFIVPVVGCVWLPVPGVAIVKVGSGEFQPTFVGFRRFHQPEALTRWQRALASASGW